MLQWKRTNILCVFSVQTVTCAIAPLPYTHTHTHSDPHVDRSKSKAALASINTLNYEKTHTLAHLFVCVSWPVFNSSLNLTCFNLRRDSCKETNKIHWLYWRQLNMIFVSTVRAGVGARVSSRASAWTGRQIHCVMAEGEHSRCCAHSIWLVVWIHGHGERMGSDVLNGFTIVCPPFIVHGTNYSVWVHECRYLTNVLFRHSKTRKRDGGKKKI